MATSFQRTAGHNGRRHTALRLESLECRNLLAGDVVLGSFCPAVPPASIFDSVEMENLDERVNVDTPLAGDVNGDGKFNTVDLEQIRELGTYEAGPRTGRHGLLAIGTVMESLPQPIWCSLFNREASEQPGEGPPDRPEPEPSRPPEDVSGDGIVSPIDALRIINVLQSHGGSDAQIHFDDPADELASLDVNDDQVVSQADVLEILRYLNDADSPPPPERAFLPEDVNHDGVVSGLDALRIINELQKHGGGPVRIPDDNPTGELASLDVDRDQLITQKDVRQVLRYLNEAASPALAVPAVPAEDVNRDGSVSALDALLIINELQANGGSPICVPMGDEGGVLSSFDVDEDQLVTHKDVQQVIDYLNATGDLGRFSAV